MDLLKLTDRHLSELHQAVLNEARRRTTINTTGHDPAAIIWGNEMAKRAVQIAAAGQHSILLVGPASSGKTMLRAVCHELGVQACYEARHCPCGDYGDPRRACNCSMAQMKRVAAKWPLADITVEAVPPSNRIKQVVGTTLAHMKDYLAKMAHHTDDNLSEDSANLLKCAATELGLDLPTQGRIVRVARTIANLDHAPHIGAMHISESINYRMFVGR